MPKGRTDKEIIGRMNNILPGRTKIDALNRIAILLDEDYPDDAKYLRQIASMLFEIRQLLRGGKLYIPGGRHYDNRV